jgi:predicted dehydrogenase
MATTLKAAIIGCGTVGDLHRERLLAEDVPIVAISDPDADALSSMASRLPHRPRLFRSEQDLLAARLVDAVVLCTPHGRHAAQIEAALDAGVHVLCEKPFVTYAAEGEALVQRARERNLALFVAFTRRSRGHARFLEAAVRRIGPIRHVSILRTQPWRARHGRTWRMRAEEGGGFLMDVGASMLDLTLRLVEGSVDDAQAQLVQRGGVEVDVEAFVTLTFLGGARAELTLLGDATESIERIVLFGENGTAGWTLREDAPYELYVRPQGGPTELGQSRNHRTLLPDAAFVAALRSGRRFDRGERDLYDAATALPVVHLVERLYREAVWR